MRVYKTSYKTKGKKKKCRIWRIKGRDHLGIMRFFSSDSKDKKVAEEIARKIEDLIGCRKSQKPLDSKSELLEFLIRNPKLKNKLIEYKVLDEEDLTMIKPLEQHIQDFCDSMENTDVTEKRVGAVEAKLKRIIKSCKFETWQDIKPKAVQNYLSRLRDSGKGVSNRTYNVYLQTIKQFCKWMVQNGRAAESPVQYLKGYNVNTDRRRVRRALSVDEVRRLLEATKAGPVRYGMSGYERHLLYRVAIETGLRANELRSLVVGSFDFKNHTVKVPSGYTKNKEEATQSLRPNTAVELKEFFKDKLPNVKAFGGTYKALTGKTAKMLRADLKKAEIGYQDEANRYFDFHALRGETASLLAASGVHPKVAQSIMRHKDINLTMSLYTHTLRGQESEAISKLPDLSQPSKSKGNAG